MAKESDEKSDGVLEGVAKEFVGLPKSFGLNTRLQNTILERQSDRSAQTANRAMMEIGAIRSAAENGSRSLLVTQWAAMQSSEHLSSIDNALQDGLPVIAEEISGLRSAAEQLVGVHTASRSIEEIAASNPSIESEVVILAMSGGLKKEQTRKLFDYLPYWKKDIIDSGLVYRGDPEKEKYYAKMESKLLPHERDFLAELRRKSKSSIPTFRSIKVLAQHRLLDDDFQSNLSETVAAARTGIGGVIDVGNQLEKQGKESNKLKRAGLTIGVGIKTSVDELVSVTHLAQADRRAIRVSSQKTAENTHAISRGISAQVYLTQHFGERAEGQRNRQIQVAEGIQRNTAGIERNTELLAVFAEEGNEIAKANLAANIETANNTGRLVELGEVNVELLGSIDESSRQTAMNTASIAQDTGQLVDFADRAELMRAVMIEQGQVRNMLLGDMADSLDTANYYLALTREQIAGVALTLIQGNEAAAERDILKINEARRTNNLLATLIDMKVAHHEDLQMTLEKIDRGMQERHLSENRARAEERFAEGLENYKKGKILDAIDLFSQSLTYWRNDHKVYFYRGLCYVLADNTKEGEKDLNEALSWAEDIKDTTITAIIKMNLARLYYAESKVYAKKGNVEISDEKMLSAILTAQEACEIAPDLHKAAFELATYLAAYQLYDDARVILMKIIPKDPTMAQRMQETDEFRPILGSFKKVIEEAQGKINDQTKDRLSIAVLKDCMEFGDFATAMHCIEELMKGGAIHLLRLKIWEIEELNPIRNQIINTIVNAIDSVEESDDSQNCYGIAMLALLYRGNQSEISDSKIFDIFLAGTQSDLDVRAKNKVAMLKKLRAISEKGTSDILTINKLHRKGLDWLF